MHPILGFVFCSRSPFRRVNFCSRSQFISKGLVSKTSKISGLWNIFDFNFLESLTFLARNILHSHTPAQLLWLRTWSGQSIFVVAHPLVPFRFAHFTPVQVLGSPHSFFFFFSNPYGVANGALRAPLVVQALRACTPDPFGVRYKNPRRGFL